VHVSMATMLPVISTREGSYPACNISGGLAHSLGQVILSKIFELRPRWSCGPNQQRSSLKNTKCA
jgi:hypothetical protein